MNSLERVKDYSEVGQESSGGINPPAIWPSRDGSIEVEHLSVRYARHSPPSLNSVSFQIKPKVCSSVLLIIREVVLIADLPQEKVGIVGRTGLHSQRGARAVF